MTAFAPLGSNSRTRNPPPHTHAAFESEPSPAALALVARLGRWRLQSVARNTLDKSKGLNNCMRSVLGDLQQVNILKSDKGFHYGGLMACGSVWVCPICASKISERRRIELAEGIANHTKTGGGVMMLTLTVPHYFKDSLLSVLDGITDALRRMLNRGTWKGKAATLKKPFRPGLSQYIGLVGRVRTLEVTHGCNGWHPHFHILLFTSAPLTAVDMAFACDRIVKPDGSGLWQSACLAAGMPCPNLQYGATLVDGREMADYVSKWGMSHEMTKGHLKKGLKAGHYGPFALLHLIADNDKKAPHLFREYAGCFVGKRQLVWSDGLKDLLGLDPDLTDEEIVALEVENASVFSVLPLAVWRVVLREDHRGELLQVCEGGILAVQDYIISLMTSDDLLSDMTLDDYQEGFSYHLN